MNAGYLSIETHPDHPGRVRLRLSPEPPDMATAGASQTRFVARYNDADAALMHVHESLRRNLVDIDSRLYRVELAHAIAAADAVALRHRVTYLDPQLDSEARAQIGAWGDRLRERRRRVEQLFRAVGYTAIGLLLLNLFVVALP